MNKKLTTAFLLVTLLLPTVAWAVNFPGLVPGQAVSAQNIQNILDNIFSFIWMLFAAFAVIMFIIAGIQSLASHGDPAKTTEVRKFVIWGAIGVVVALLSVSIPWIISSVLFPAAPVMPPATP